MKGEGWVSHTLRVAAHALGYGHHKGGVPHAACLFVRRGEGGAKAPPRPTLASVSVSGLRSFPFPPHRPLRSCFPFASVCFAPCADP